MIKKIFSKVSSLLKDDTLVPSPNEIKAGPAATASMPTSASKEHGDDIVRYFEEHILTPRLLGERISDVNMLVLGTCQVEHLVSSGPKYGFNLDHILYDGITANSLPENTPNKYDAILVGLTLRTIANIAAQGAYDVFYLQAPWTSEFAAATLDRAQSMMEDTLTDIRNHFPGIPIFIMTYLEPSRNSKGNIIFNPSDYSNIRYFVRGMNERLSAAASKMEQSYIFDYNDAINFVGRAHLHDEMLSFTMHASIISGFDDEHDRARIIPPVSNLDTFDVKHHLDLLHACIFNTLADDLMIIKSRDAVKIIITDLDDTMWRGIAAENDVEEWLRVEGWPLGYQEALLEFRRRGGLLAICSKNDEATTRASFARICGNRLTLDDFVSVKINWQPKSENIAEILSEANLLPESALFIDDNPREVAEVKSQFPTLRCLGGNHHDWRRVILNAPQMQVPFISHESSLRTELVRSRIDREVQAKKLPRSEWLKSLEIKQSFALVDSMDHPLARRMLELINKTNQFNTTGIRWEAGEVLDLFSNGGCCIVSSLSDKNANNGVIGVAMLRPGEIVQVVLSCRVFGLGAEFALGSIATSVAMSNGAAVTSRIVDTGKNASCRDYFNLMGYEATEIGYVIHTIPQAPAWIAIEHDAALTALAATAA